MTDLRIPTFAQWINTVAGDAPKLRAPETTVTEGVGRAIERGLTRLGVSERRAVGMARTANQALGFTPVGAVTEAIDAGRKARREPTVAGQVQALGSGAVMAALGAVPGGKAVRKGITAYHGSPHTFDRFSLDKIGTGEGAQAYGHGLYFAENEAVAKGYRDELSSGRFFADGKPVDGIRGQAVYDAKGLTAKAKDHLAWYVNRGYSVEDAVKDAASRLGAKDLASFNKAIQQKRFEFRDLPGSMYQVQINADLGDFLDYDAPLASQPGKVIRGVKGALESHGFAGDFGEFVKNSSGMNVAARKPEQVERLRNAGIPGIKYLDQGSRTAGDGSRNFVVFDDKLIDILKRYGIAVPTVAVPTFASFLETQQPQPDPGA